MHTVVGMSVGAVRGAHIYLQGAWVVAGPWPDFPGRGGGVCVRAHRHHGTHGGVACCCGLAVSRHIVMLSRCHAGHVGAAGMGGWHWRARTGAPALVRPHWFAASSCPRGAEVLAPSALLGGVQMAVCGA